MSDNKLVHYRVSEERPNVEEYVKQFPVPEQWTNDFKEIMFTKEEIDVASARLAQEISAVYADIATAKEPIIVIGLLKGCIYTYVDITRQLTIPTQAAFIQASSYGTSTISSGQLTMTLDVSEDLIKGRHVCLIEDMADTGSTLNRIRKHLEGKGAASVKLCIMFDKVDRRTAPVEIDFCGYFCPDHFAVGYGLDFAENYRTLPFVACLKPEVYQ